MRKEICCRHIGYSFWLTARVLLYAPSHRQDSTYHILCYTSRGALAVTRNSSMGSPHEGSIRRPIAPWANTLTTELHLSPWLTRMLEIVSLWRGNPIERCMRCSISKHKELFEWDAISKHKELFEWDAISKHKELFEWDAISKHKELFEWDAISKHKELFEWDAISKHKELFEWDAISSFVRGWRSDPQVACTVR